MLVLFLHGLNGVPGGIKPTYLKDHDHEVLNPALPDEMLKAAEMAGVGDLCHLSLFAAESYNSPTNQ